MKNLKTLLGLALVSAALLIFNTGCNTSAGKAIDRALFRPTAWATNAVPESTVQVKTNQLVVMTQTNAAGEVTGRVTNREPVVLNVTIPAHTEVVPTAWAPNEQTTAVANLAGGFGGPYGAVAATGFTALLGLIAAFRGKKYKEAAISIAEGVEHFASSTASQGQPNIGDALKDVLKQVQEDRGTRGTVTALLANNVNGLPEVPRVTLSKAPSPA